MSVWEPGCIPPYDSLFIIFDAAADFIFKIQSCPESARDTHRTHPYAYWPPTAAREKMATHSDEAGQVLRNGKYKRTVDEQPAPNDQKRAALGDISNKALQRCEQVGITSNWRGAGRWRGRAGRARRGSAGAGDSEAPRTPRSHVSTPPAHARPACACVPLPCPDPCPGDLKARRPEHSCRRAAAAVVDADDAARVEANAAGCGRATV
jgi:hypothetical protein